MSWWYKFICEVVPKHDGGKLSKKMHGYYWEHASSFHKLRLGPSWKMGKYMAILRKKMIWLLLPLQACHE